MADYRGYKIECDCGEKIRTDLESDLELAAEETIETEEYECDNCGRVYELTIEAEVEVTTWMKSLVLKSIEIADWNGNTAIVSDDMIGSEVDLEDGQYRAQGRVWVIVDGVLDDVWDDQTIEGQMQLAI